MSGRIEGGCSGAGTYGLLGNHNHYHRANARAFCVVHGVNRSSMNRHENELIQAAAGSAGKFSEGLELALIPSLCWVNTVNPSRLITMVQKGDGKPARPEEMQAPKGEEKGLRRSILDTARQLLTTVGYARLSMRNIANEIGYSATSIYLHFESKDDLVHALIDEGVDLLHARMVEADQGASSPEGRLEAMCRAYVAFGMERPEYYEIMYVNHPEYIKRYPAEKYRKARRNLEIMALAIKDGMQAGTFREVEPMLAANLAWTQLHGVVTLLSSERVDKRIDPDELINAACLHVVDAMRRWAETVVVSNS